MIQHILFQGTHVLVELLLTGVFLELSDKISGFQGSFWSKFWFSLYILYIFTSPSSQDREKSVSFGRLFLPNRPLGWPLTRQTQPSSLPILLPCIKYSKYLFGQGAWLNNMITWMNIDTSSPSNTPEKKYNDITISSVWYNAVLWYFNPVVFSIFVTKYMSFVLMLGKIFQQMTIWNIIHIFARK